LFPLCPLLGLLPLPCCLSFLFTLLLVQMNKCVLKVMYLHVGMHRIITP
jgi:hypothetical protein